MRRIARVQEEKEKVKRRTPGFFLKNVNDVEDVEREGMDKVNKAESRQYKEFEYKYEAYVEDLEGVSDDKGSNYSNYNNYYGRRSRGKLKLVCSQRPQESYSRNRERSTGDSDNKFYATCYPIRERKKGRRIIGEEKNPTYSIFNYRNLKARKCISNMIYPSMPPQTRTPTHAKPHKNRRSLSISKVFPTTHTPNNNNITQTQTHNTQKTIQNTYK